MDLALLLSDRVASEDLEAAVAEAREVNGVASRALHLAAGLGATVPLPGTGNTTARWEYLARIATADLTAARVCESHLDALAIIAEATADGLVDDLTLAAPGTTWGVFAAEGPAGRLSASETAGTWMVDGIKPWCSLATSLDRALVTAFVSDADRQLFAVDLTDPSVRVKPATWISAGLAEVPSGPVQFDRVAAEPVGPAGWYLRRPGFAWGGLGVAACWYGGAVGLARRLFESIETALADPSARPPDQVAYLHAGKVDAHLESARAVLRSAAEIVDDGHANGAAGERLALRVRNIVAAVAEKVIEEVGHALGPAPLAFETAHARRVADLQIYLRQHHAERDAVALGRALFNDGKR